MTINHNEKFLIRTVTAAKKSLKKSLVSFDEIQSSDLYDFTAK